MLRQPIEQEDQRSFANNSTLSTAIQRVSYLLLFVAAIRLSKGDYTGAVAELFYAFTSLAMSQTLKPSNNERHKFGYLCAAIGLFVAGRMIDSERFFPEIPSSPNSLAPQ